MTPSPGRTVGLVAPAGPVSYRHAHSLQRTWLEERKRGVRPDTLLLLEHPPVITLGRNADASNILADRGRLARLGVEVHRIERGGQATYHGPGQLVGYPILSLPRLQLGVRQYVNRLEEMMLRTAEAFGVTAYRWPGRPGVYCDRGKLGAVGVAVSRGIAYHGFAFNVHPDLDHFRLIIPCGLTDVSAASLETATGGAGPDVDTSRGVLARAFEEVFSVRLVSASGSERLVPAPCPVAGDRVRTG